MPAGGVFPSSPDGPGPGTQMTGGTIGAENVNIPRKKRMVLSTFQQAVQNEAMGELRDALGELRDALGEPDAARSMVTV